MDPGARFGKYRVEREVLDEQRLEELAKKKTLSEIHKPLTSCLKDYFRCTLPKLKRSVVSSCPVLYWLPKYSFWDYGMPDIVSGISVGIMHLPQGMAYALLASVPPVFGLYTSLYPALIYFFFGTSRHISIGTFTVLSIMVGSLTERLAPDENFLIRNGTNLTSEVDITARDSYRVQVAAATTVLGGLIQVLLGAIKFGFVGTYLSEPLVRAYTSAAAAHAVVAQLKHLFGVSPKRFNGPLSQIYVGLIIINIAIGSNMVLLKKMQEATSTSMWDPKTLVAVCLSLPQTHLPTLLVSSVTIVLLIAAKELNSFLSTKLPLPVPVELIAIAAATLISSSAQLNNNYSVSVVGEIPSGLRAPTLPDLSLFGEVIGDAFALAIVGYAISISLGKTFALKHGYKVDSNQELVAHGLSNAVGGFFQCFSVCSSMSRSLVQETTGGKTQMAGVVSALIVLVTILKLGTLFQELPKELHDVHIWCTTVLHALPVYLREEVSGCLRTFVAVLAGIVLVNLKGMFKQYYDVTLWRRSKIDLVIWLVTWVSTVLLNLDLGLAASIVFALFTVTFRTQMPTYSVLGNVPGTELYVDVETHKEAREVPGVTIFRSSATVYFANAEFYLEALKAKSGLDISKMIIYKRRQEAKQRRREKSAERRAKKQAKKAAKQHSGLPEIYLEEVEADDWRDPHIDMTAAEKEEQSTTERGNGTVFVVPTTPRTPDGSSRWEYLKSGDPDSTSLGWISELPDGDTTTLGSSSEDTLSRDLEQVSLGSLGKWTWDIHSIILDLSTVNFIDTVAIQALKNVFRDFIEIDVDIYFCGCQSSVIEQLERGDFFSETIRKQHMFVSVHDAVLYCLNHRGAASLPRYDPTQVLQSGTKF